MLLKSPLDLTTDFGLINHQKWLTYFNTSFGRLDCFLIVQEAIPTQQNKRIKRQNKVEI